MKRWVHAYNTISVQCLDRSTDSRWMITRLDPPSLPLPRLHAPHPILPHARIPVPSLLPHIPLLLHRTPPLPPPRTLHLPESVRRGISVLGGNLVTSSGLVGIFHLAVRGSPGGIGHLVVLLSACQYKM